jgi:pSer/pThr/pTyr-binding forkhead associated (FHA) protein
MPRLILQFHDRVLKDCVVGPHVVRIGRLPDNTVVIDNEAVSSHHARVVAEGDRFVLEDLNSTNGTFVDGQRITRHTLRHGDVVLVGKHTLVFDETPKQQPAAATKAGPDLPELGGTILFNARQRAALLAAVQQAAGTPATAPPTTPLAPHDNAAVLHVLAGRADQSEYPLQGHISLVGKSDLALVRLKGWFKPKVAVAIARKGDSYQATRLSGRVRINSQPLTGRQDLKNGDILQVGGLTLQFRLPH